MTTIEETLEHYWPPVPWMYELAAALNDEPIADMYSDAGVISRSLANVIDLFGLPAVAVPFDTTLLAEAAGCTVEFENGRPRAVEGTIETIDDALEIPLDSIAERGRLQTTLDAAERLTSVVDDASVLGCVTGPGVLVDQLLAATNPSSDLVDEIHFTVGDLLSAVTNTYLAVGVDGILVLEPGGLRSVTAYEEVLHPLCNVLDHYSAPGIVAAERITETDLDRAASVGFRAVTGYTSDPVSLSCQGVVTGIGVPRQAFLDGETAVRQFVDQHSDTALLSSEWTIPPQAPPEAVHALMGSL